MIEKSCDNCDYSYKQAWNNGKPCFMTRFSKVGSCRLNEYFVLRRDKRICANCIFKFKHHEDLPCHKCHNNKLWEPIPEKQKKENICDNCSDVMCLDRGDGKRNFVSLCCNFKQKKEKLMKYIPTEKFTLKNVLGKAWESKCHDVLKGVVDVLNTIAINNHVLPLIGNKIQKGYDIYECAMSIPKYKKWLLKEGFIKEDVWFEPCLYCHESNVKMDYKPLADIYYMVKCMNCGVTGPEAETEEEARKKWNKE